MSCKNSFLLQLDSKAVMTVGEMYFDKTKLKINMDNTGCNVLIAFVIREVGDTALGGCFARRKRSSSFEFSLPT